MNVPSLISTLGIDQLSFEERLQLVEEIWDSIGENVVQRPLSEARRQELSRRLAALDADPESTHPWEEVEARVLARLRK
jgi:putative addiction module component (TIGR02574 family)